MAYEEIFTDSTFGPVPASVQRSPKKNRSRRTLELPPGYAFVVDTREQQPYDLGGPTEHRKLETGDYSLVGFEEDVVVERKNPNDLLGCITSQRKRFERELERMKAISYAALVIESDWGALRSGRYKHSLVNPDSVLGSIVAWSQRYGVFLFVVGGRREGADATRRILWRAAWDHHREIREVLKSGSQANPGEGRRT